MLDEALDGEPSRDFRRGARPLANRLLGEAGTLVVAEPIQCDKTQNKISNIKIIYDVIYWFGAIIIQVMR